MKITVTQNNIDNGVPKNSCKCPIARALKQIFPGEDIEVKRSSIYIGKSIHYAMPLKACYFIVDFDEGREVYPFEFEV